MKTSLYLAAALLTATAGCIAVDSEPELDNVEQAETELLGNHDGDSTCTPYTEAMVSQASRMARTITNSNAFAQCVQQRMVNYIPCGDPFAFLSRDAQVRKAWEALQKTNHMKYTCSYESVRNISAQADNTQGWGTRNTHVVDLADDWGESFGHWQSYEGRGYQNFEPFHWRASDIVHEYLHTHNYSHPVSGCGAGYDGGPNSIPYIYGDCVNHIVEASFNNCSNFESGDADEMSLVDSWPATTSCERVSDPLHRVALRTYNGRYVSAINGGGGAVDAHGAGHGPWETLFFIDLNGGRLMSGDWVHVKTSEGSFWRRTGGGLDGGLVDPTVASTARFQIIVSGGGEFHSGMQISLRAANGSYVVAEGGGGGAVNANRSRIGAWERFTAEAPRRAHIVRLRAESTNKFVFVRSDGTMSVNGSGGGESRSFWIIDHNGGKLENGDSISLETLRGSTFVSTCRNGSGRVRGDANYISNCSRFTIVKRSGSTGNVIGHQDKIALRSSNSRYLTAMPDYPGYQYQLLNYYSWISPWQIFEIDLPQGDRWTAR